MRERITSDRAFIEADFRAGFFRHLMRLSPSFFDTTTPAI
jgi:hypothetical protein